MAFTYEGELDLELEEEAAELETLLKHNGAATPSKPRATVPGDSSGRPIRTLDKFAPRQARLSPFHFPAIHDVAANVVGSWRSDTPIRTICLASHTDNTGRAPHDTQLASRRARAVQGALTAAIDRLRPGLGRKIRFVHRSLGSRQPFTRNDTSEGRALNRRVEIFSYPTGTVLAETAPGVEYQLAGGRGERVIEASLNGNNGTEAYFFLADHYVTYSWTNDRVSDGVRPVSDWALPPSIAGIGPGSGLDAALNGKRAYIDKAYFFKGANYARVKFAGRVIETPDPPPSINPAWRFPAEFASDIDAAFNGRFSREGKAFFFKKDKYLRYRWGDASGRGDGVDYVHPMRNLKGMPADFATGVDAAVDGDGAWARYGYLFKEGRYIRMDWNPSHGDPLIDGPAANIQDKWPGLVELLFAGKAKAQALDWVDRARLELSDYSNFVSGTTPTYANQALMEAALLTHFRIDPAMPAAQKTPLLTQIAASFRSVQSTLNNSPSIFRYRTDAEVAADRGKPDIPAAYTHIPTGTINFTRIYPARGPLCRAAMALHESVHVFDNQSTSASTHIPEWYVTNAEAAKLGLPTQPNMPQFARRYDEMPTSDKLHNPSSFASFAQHIRYSSDTRYGNGKPTL